MKRNKGGRAYLLALVLFLAAVVVGCGNSDQAIKADLTTKAMNELEFLGVRFTVQAGTVTLSGNCPTQKAKDVVAARVKGVFGVQSVVNNIRIAPVVVGTDQLLKRGVDSVLKKYPGVQAVVLDSAVTLEGRVKQQESGQLFAAIEALKPLRFDNRVSVTAN